MARRDRDVELKEPATATLGVNHHGAGRQGVAGKEVSEKTLWDSNHVDCAKALTMLALGDVARAARLAGPK